MLVMGLMSGTSADGIDAVLVSLEGGRDDMRWQFVRHTHTPMEPSLRGAIMAACNPATSSVDVLCRLNAEVGEAFAIAATRAANKAGLALSQIDLIGSHGQTVWHDVAADGHVTSTLQIGDGAIIAARTGVTTISDFRVADVAAGGQGAPLVPFADYILFRDPHKFRAVQNIGGIANVTLLPPGCTPADVTAFDSGPGNMVIDALVELMTNGHEAFDHDGHIAASGHVYGTWLEELLDHPYFKRMPPKTTGRELFGKQYAKEVWERGKALGMQSQDIIATVTAQTAESIAQVLLAEAPLQPHQAAATRRAPDELILGGGGAFNPTLIGMIAERLPGTKVLRHEDFGIPSLAKEALAFAILAYMAIRREPNNLPAVTGASRPVVMGKVSYG